ncbi:hypothetical protein BDW59DRAFT_146737 [Aspergillus cavernicola]|uniref:Zn(2)-C6 fungal-type domain-containing protein n=1 Tax=Aspergillus cavernicola TaxID=176166 RepID=A0ABR4IBE5_9EURO
MESTPSKRSSPSEPPRSRKRAKYIQLACNECKRRKLKCDGKHVCSRCVRQNVECLYTPTSHALSNAPVTLGDEAGGKDDGLSNKFRTVEDRLECLQREMCVMAARMRELESGSGTPSASNIASLSSSISAGLQRIMNRPVSPDYIGPTSAEFGIGIHQKPADERDEDESESTAAPSPAAVSDVEAMSTDPLGCLGKEEALRLVTVYENNVGLMYPCIDLDSVRSYVNDYYKDEERSGPTPPGMTDQDWFFARDAEVLKVLLATALLAESHGRSERAALLADSVEDRFAARLKIPEVDMKELLILTLLSIFHSYRDDEVISWRLIGMAVRGSMQLGLHRQETWLRTGGVFPGELQFTFASRLFWCIYVLDRKWSFGTGLPFAIQDSDMDTNLPEPGAATRYLTCMIHYARLSTKIWGLVMGWPSRPKAATADYCSYLDFQVQQWIQSIPRELRFEPRPSGIPTSPSPSPSASNPNHASSSKPETTTQGTTMLSVLLALQANQLRILVYRQNLLSSASIEQNPPGASTAVETAKSTIHMLDYFSRVSDIYFQRPEPFNYFLLSALAALFLAVLHAPSRFSCVCRGEFYVAVGMVRRSSVRGRMSRRLRKIIGSLKVIRLSLDGGMKQQTPTHQPRHPIPPSELLPTPHNRQQASVSVSVSSLPTPGPHPPNSLFSVPSPPPQPNAWVDENSCEDLTSFFEMAGGLYFDPRVDPGLGGEAFPEQSGISEAMDAFEAEDEALTRVMAGLL